MNRPAKSTEIHSSIENTARMVAVPPAGTSLPVARPKRMKAMKKLFYWIKALMQFHAT